MREIDRLKIAILEEADFIERCNYRSSENITLRGIVERLRLIVSHYGENTREELDA
jgi:hypothetical protein